MYTVLYAYCAVCRQISFFISLHCTVQVLVIHNRHYTGMYSLLAWLNFCVFSQGPNTVHVSVSIILKGIFFDEKVFKIDYMSLLLADYFVYCIFLNQVKWELMDMNQYQIIIYCV